MNLDHANFDGACGPPNPGGVGGWGYLIRSREGAVLSSGCGRLAPRPAMTNNVAEYAAAGAAIAGYRALQRPGPLLVLGDSQLVIMQMSGQWRIKAGAYVHVAHRLRALLAECAFAVEWRWIPRAQNAEADALAREGQERAPSPVGDVAAQLQGDGERPR